MQKDKLTLLSLPLHWLGSVFPVHAQYLYGSIAYTQTSDGGYAGGMAWNAESRANARQSAIQECRWMGGGNACREVGWFRNACGAIAIGDNSGYGTGWGDSSSAAERAAMNNCRSGNNGCRVEVSRCTELSTAVGVNRATRRQIQEALAAQGFDPGPADGIFGPRTHSAIKAWQSSKGGAATGELTNEQVTMLLAASTRGDQPQPANAAGTSGELWGSIVYSPQSRLGVIVWNSAGRDPARRQALQSCTNDGGAGCQEVAWFRNACGAIAIADGTGYGAGWGDTTGWCKT